MVAAWHRTLILCNAAITMMFVTGWVVLHQNARRLILSFVSVSVIQTIEYWQISTITVYGLVELIIYLLHGAGGLAGTIFMGMMLPHIMKIVSSAGSPLFRFCINFLTRVVEPVRVKFFRGSSTVDTPS